MGDSATAAVPQIAALLSDANAAVAATYALGQIGQIPTDAEAKIRPDAKGDDKLLSAQVCGAWRVFIPPMTRSMQKPSNN